jgi:hypothetical protein
MVNEATMKIMMMAEIVGETVSTKAVLSTEVPPAEVFCETAINRARFYVNQRPNVTAIVLEIPRQLISREQVRAWATVSLYGHAPEVQVSRWGPARYGHERGLQSRCSGRYGHGILLLLQILLCIALLVILGIRDGIFSFYIRSGEDSYKSNCPSRERFD